MPEKIMVVDDEPDLESLVRQRFRRQIRNGEYEFLFAGNGLEALARLLEHPECAMILSDINMPEMDGLTLLAKLNELKNPALKTVIVSAYGDMENIRTAMNRGAFDFVTKPVDFNDLETTIKKSIDESQILRRAQQDHDRLLSIQRDLDIARDIQQAILPQEFPAFPERKEFDLFASMTAAKEVGGDFYDFFLIDQDHLGVVIGDVSGKGVPSAIFMAVSRTLMRATALKGIPPQECLGYVNRLLCRESVSSMFVTMFYAILTMSTGELVYSNGGHNAPYLIHSGGEVSPVELTGDMALGLFEEIEYKNKSFTMKKGDFLVLYTDGVTEAMNCKEDFYLESRLEQVLRGEYASGAADLTQHVLEDVRVFVDGYRQSDDITMLTLKYLGE